jgi:NDP-sugar pyrophosphorylase family protein
MLNIVIPMAGAGSRFTDAGYTDPKPLIMVNGAPMIELVVKNLTPKVRHRFIFIVQKLHFHTYGLESLLNRISEDPKIVLVDGITEGAACTVLRATDWINNSDELMIANSDQYLEFEIDQYLQSSVNDGLVMTMRASGNKWSYIKTDQLGFVNEVAEKKEISEIATTGVYNFKKGSMFVDGAHEMINNNDRVNGEFYVAPVFNYLIRKNLKINHFSIGESGEAMYGLGTPEDLNYFLASGPNIK